MTSVNIIIVAAGSGLRYGAPLPKQFCLLAGKPVVMHTIERLRELLPHCRMKLVISRDMSDYWMNLCEEYTFESPEVVFGGSSRWASVRNAVTTLTDENDSITMIHDAVRPVVDSATLQGLTEAMSSDDIDGAIPVTPVTDTLREVFSNGTSASIDRSRFRAVQTPQAFRTSKLKVAYHLPYKQSFTDDASVMEAAGFGRLKMTSGSPHNIKITNPGDIAVAELYIGR